MPNSTTRRSWSVPLAVFFVVLGLVLNRPLLESTIVADGAIESPLLRLLILLGELGLVAIGVGLALRRPGITLLHLAAVAAGVMASLVIGGVAVQLFYTPPSVISGWRSSVPKSERNQLGFRGHPIQYAADEAVVVLLGDSVAEARACAYGWMPERRLQHHLEALGKKVRVFTLGARGYGQDQELLVMREYYQNFRADLVLLWQTPDNDIWNNVFPTHWPRNGTPKPTFWLENGALRGPSEAMEASVPKPRIGLVALVDQLFGGLDRDQEWESRLPPAYEPQVSHEGTVDDTLQLRWNSDMGLMRMEQLDSEKSHLAMLLTPRSRRMQYGLDLTRRLLQEIEKLVVEHGGRFVVFRHARAEPTKEGTYVLNGKFYGVSTRQFDANLEEVNRGFTTLVVPVTVEDSRVGPEDGHLNEHATDQVMQDLARLISDRVPDRAGVR